MAIQWHWRQAKIAKKQLVWRHYFRTRLGAGRGLSRTNFCSFGRRVYTRFSAIVFCYPRHFCLWQTQKTTASLKSSRTPFWTITDKMSGFLYFCLHLFIKTLHCTLKLQNRKIRIYIMGMCLMSMTLRQMAKKCTLRVMGVKWIFLTVKLLLLS